MTSSSNPLAAPRPVSRRWRWILAVGLIGGILALLLTAPRLACWALQRQTPLVSDAVVVRGVQFGGSLATAAMVVGRCSPAELKRIVEGASGRWLPGIVLGDGQHAWGTFIDAPEVTWRLDVDASASVPEITARIPQAIAERVVARYLISQRSPVSQVRLRQVSLVGEPHGNTQIAWQARLGGSVQAYLWEQSLAIEVEQATVVMTTMLTPDAAGDAHLQAQLQVSELRGSTPLGPLTPLLPMLEKLANQELGREITTLVVPGWWPLTTRWDLRVVASEISEF